MNLEDMTAEAREAYEIGKEHGAAEAIAAIGVTSLCWAFSAEHDTWTATGIAGEYRAWQSGGSAHWLVPGDTARRSIEGGTTEDAKAHCDAHQGALVRSVLIVPGGVRKGIFVSGSHKTADLWTDLRMFERMPIISSWIDEPGVMETNGRSAARLRGIEEVKTAAAFIVYRRVGEDIDTVALEELKVALDADVPVFAIGLDGVPEGADHRIRHCRTLVEARRLAGVVAPIPERSAA